MSALWDAIRGMLAEGKDPVVTLTLDMLVVPDRKRPGPVPREKQEPTEIDKAARPLLGDKARPRCINPHCRLRLKSKQREARVCNDYCREEALMAFRAVVDLLLDHELPIEDVPDVKDTQAYARRVRIDGPTERHLRGRLERNARRSKSNL